MNHNVDDIDYEPDNESLSAKDAIQAMLDDGETLYDEEGGEYRYDKKLGGFCYSPDGMIETKMDTFSYLRKRPMIRYYTPKQWKQLTGKPWPEEWAVYVLVRNKHTKEKCYRWEIFSYYATRPFRGHNPIVCATEAGKPPKSWRPEEEDR